MTVTLDRLEALVARLEALGIAPLADEVDEQAIVIPPYVAPGELIESVWGNKVVDALIYLSTRNGLTAIGSPSIASNALQQVSWSQWSTPTWGNGPVFVAPVGTEGLYVFSCDVDGPQMGVDQFADVSINVKAQSYVSYIPPGKSQVTAFAMIDISPGDQVSVQIYNPTPAAAFFTTTLNIYRYSA